MESGEIVLIRKVLFKKDGSIEIAFNFFMTIKSQLWKRNHVWIQSKSEEVRNMKSDILETRLWTFRQYLPKQKFPSKIMPKSLLKRQYNKMWPPILFIKY